MTRKPMTLAEFLDWEERQELPFEFDGFGPVAMNGGTIEHALIQANLHGALHTRLRGGRCRAYNAGLKVEVAAHIRHPDVFVVCSEQTRGATIARQPVVVFEILSPGTSRTDRIVKAREYGETESIQRYVILEQTGQAATVFTRMNGLWASVVIEGDTDLTMPEIGVTVPLAEIYLDVTFPPEEEA